VTRSTHGGASVPAWIAEQVARYERDWPFLALGAASAASALGLLAIGLLIWNVDAFLCYARP
jgi:hypothetical protein